MQQLDIPFSDLRIEANDAAQLMGFGPENVPEPFPELLAGALHEAGEHCMIRAGYRHCPAPVMVPGQRQIIVDGVTFSPGQTVFNQLRNSEHLVVFMATAGLWFSNRLRELSGDNDSVLAYVYDVVGSLVAGKAAEWLLDRLEAETENAGWCISDPYSPGYCEWDVSEQNQLFSLFPPGFCGITLSGSCLMIPVKSVSGMAGIGPGMKRKGIQCVVCNAENCMYGKLTRRKFSTQQC